MIHTYSTYSFHSLTGNICHKWQLPNSVLDNSLCHLRASSSTISIFSALSPTTVSDNQTTVSIIAV